VAPSDRFKRPILDRDSPIRSWSTLFATAPRGVAGSTPDGAAMAERDDSLNGVVARSVDLGYRVVDEYIRQGQKAAQRINERTYGAETMASDAQDLAMRMLQYASDFAAVWLEFVQLASTGSAARPAASASGDGSQIPPQPSARPPQETAPSESSEIARVRIEMLSTHPTEVSFEIRPLAVRRPLLVHALRAVDPEKPRLTEVVFHPGSDDAPARLRIHVPADQPPGTYSGLIVEEETSRPAGSVSVRVGPQ
jgi:hypothetical protein